MRLPRGGSGGAALSGVLALICAVSCVRRLPPAAPPVPHDAAGPVRAVCKGRLVLARETIRFEAAYAVVPPDRLYAEIGGRAGGARAVLALREGLLTVLLPRQRGYLSEEARPETLEALAGLPFDAGALVGVLAAAGSDASWRIPARSGEQVSLLVHGRGARLEVVPEGGGPFRGLDLRFHDVERPPRSSIEETLFDLSIPPGWTPIDFGTAPPGRPVLFP